MLCCPAYKAAVEPMDEGLRCSSPDCGIAYPVQDGIPVLINDSNSVFSISDFTSRKDTFFTRRGRIDLLVDRALPKLTSNLRSRRNYAKLAEMLCAEAESPKVLVIGGSILGEGMATLLESPRITTVDTDISFGPRTKVICDGHDIPFADSSFDGVIAQAVLEHVVDPHRCVLEMHRVLKPGGYVYGEVPFMYPVHGREYDFTRFTHMGLRRLFRAFDEVDSGCQGGPGMALAVSWQWFLWSFSDRKLPRKALKATARLTGWLWKYFDHYLVNRDAALDSASGCYYLGRKTDTCISDKELLKSYRGGLAH